MIIEKAIEKINAEMQKKPDDKYLEIIGHYLIDCCTDTRIAEALLAENKTLNGACEAIRAEAKKRAKGGVGILDLFEGLDVVDKYFKLPLNSDVRGAIIRQLYGAVQPPPTAASSPDPLKLDFDSFM